MENSINEFLHQISKLCSECDRREEGANLKVSKYLLKRINTSITAVELIILAMKSMKESNTLVTCDDMEVMLSKMKLLQEYWFQKYQSIQKTSEQSDFSRYSAKKLYTGFPGRPRFNVDMEYVMALQQYSFKLKTIAEILSIDRSTLWRHMKAAGIDAESKWTCIDNNVLDAKISKIKEEHPLCGEVAIIGFLRSQNVHVQRRRIRESIHRVDPVNAALRWFHQNPRWVYSVPGPNSLWHNDGIHKLIHWGLVVHACCDGFSRLAVYLICASNNLPETVLSAFLEAEEVYGLPARVRGDRGGENVDLMQYIRRKQQYEGAYIQGPSVHNQRIERLHYDTNHAVLSYYIDLFLFMEEENILNRNDKNHLFALHIVYIPRLQRSLDRFKEAWNHHPMSTEKNRSPYQQWLEGMMDSKRQDQRGVRTFLESLNADGVDMFGVEPMVLDHVENDVETVEVNDIFLGENAIKLKAEIVKEVNSLEDDHNHGIDLFIQVKERVIAGLSQ